jgi:hypothetical protein
MFEFQSVRRSFPRNLTENSEAASFHVDKVKSVKKNHGGFPTEVSDMARNMKIELLTFSLSVEKLWTQNTRIIHDICFLLILSNEEKRMIMKILKKECQTVPNCPCSNFSRYVDLFQEISPRIAKQLRFQVKLHHLRRKCKNDKPGFFTNGMSAMKNLGALLLRKEVKCHSSIL